MASRFGNRNARSSLFSAYDSTQARTKSSSPTRVGGYRYISPSTRSTSNNPTGGAFGAYPGGGGGSAASSTELNGQFRTATPNKRGQYSDAVLSELESQNDDQLEGMSQKVRMLKDITSAIGNEIRDSSVVVDKMNDSFENTRVRLRGTMNRMLRMADKTGVGWKVWLGFFAVVILLFWYVWLF